MKRRRILIIGGLAAGPSAAAKAKRVNPGAEVTLFEATETVSYGLCEAPYAIAGVIPDEAKLVIYTPERLRDEKGIDARTLHRVEKISPSKHTITVRDMRRRTLDDHPYDKLIIAAGALPKRLGLDGEDARNVFHLSRRDDTVNILRYLADEKPSAAVIIGGGYIGMEMAEALRTRGLEVTLVHKHKLPMEGLEPAARERVLEELTKNGVEFVTNARTEALVTGEGARVTHVVTNRGTFDAGIVILAVGVEPNAALARKAGIRLGPAGGILTGERQETSADDIFAAGDCCEVTNLVTGKPMFVPLATVASRTAWVAGENAAGGRARFKGALRAIAVKVFGIEVARVGLGADEAKKAGFAPAVESITAPSKVGIMPGSEKITVAIVFDTKTGRLLGANLYGGGGAVLRADVLAAAIQQKLTVDELAQLDLIYSPPFAPLWDPILIAANKARNR